MITPMSVGTLAHGVHGVMALVAVEGPVAFLVCHEFDLPHLADRNIGVSPPGQRVLLAQGPPSVPVTDEFMTMQMDRMVGHRQVANSNANLVVQADVQAVDSRKIRLFHVHRLKSIMVIADLGRALPGSMS